MTVWLPSVKSISRVSRQRRAATPGAGERGGTTVSSQTSMPKPPPPHPGTASGLGAPAAERCCPWDGAALCSDSHFQVKPLFVAKSVAAGGVQHGRVGAGVWGRFFWSPSQGSWLSCGCGARGAPWWRVLRRAKQRGVGVGGTLLRHRGRSCGRGGEGWRRPADGGGAPCGISGGTAGPLQLPSLQVWGARGETLAGAESSGCSLVVVLPVSRV